MKLKLFDGLYATIDDKDLGGSGVLFIDMTKGMKVKRITIDIEELCKKTNPAKLIVKLKDNLFYGAEVYNTL